MTEDLEYKGIDFQIELNEAGGRWNWSANVLDMRLNLSESRARTEDTARSEAVDAARGAISRKLGRKLYTRKSDGVAFTYAVEYRGTAPGRATWSSKVYREDDLVGEPGGMAMINNLTGDSLYFLFCTLTEESIEHGVSING